MIADHVEFELVVRFQQADHLDKRIQVHQRTVRPCPTDDHLVTLNGFQPLLVDIRIDHGRDDFNLAIELMRELGQPGIPGADFPAPLADPGDLPPGFQPPGEIAIMPVIEPDGIIEIVDDLFSPDPGDQPFEDRWTQGGKLAVDEYPVIAMQCKEQELSPAIPQQQVKDPDPATPV